MAPCSWAGVFACAATLCPVFPTPQVGFAAAGVTACVGQARADICRRPWVCSAGGLGGRCVRRPLPAGCADRSRRHGPGLRRARRAARPTGRGEAAGGAIADGASERFRREARRRREPQPPERRVGLRLGRGRERPLPRDGAGRRPQPARRPRTAVARCRRARSRPSARRSPARSNTRTHTASCTAT